MAGAGGEVLVRTLDIGSGRYLCSYMPHLPGFIELNLARIYFYYRWDKYFNRLYLKMK